MLTSALAGNNCKCRPALCPPLQFSTFYLVCIVMYSDTDMPQKFADQFLPFSINQNISWKKANTTILRMPLAIKTSSDESKTIVRSLSSEVAVENMLKNFIKHASTALLFLNSVEAVRCFFSLSSLC
jgi:hypothetical protein